MLRVGWGCESLLKTQIRDSLDIEAMMPGIDDLDDAPDDVEGADVIHDVDEDAAAAGITGGCDDDAAAVAVEEFPARGRGEKKRFQIRPSDRETERQRMKHRMKCFHHVASTS